MEHCGRCGEQLACSGAVAARLAGGGGLATAGGPTGRRSGDGAWAWHRRAGATASQPDGVDLAGAVCAHPPRVRGASHSPPYHRARFIAIARPASRLPWPEKPPLAAMALPDSSRSHGPEDARPMKGNTRALTRPKGHGALRNKEVDTSLKHR